jgi:sulfatase maturation enzyme AslB (radical SAM superfamily)
MICWNPFIELRCNTVLYSTCCPAWLDAAAYLGAWTANYGLIKDLRPWEVWNHPILQRLRNAILAGDYSTYCAACSRITAGHIEAQSAVWLKPIMELPPRRLWLEHDTTCNLRCVTCRREFAKPGVFQAQRDVKVLEICREFLPTARELVVMSAGEPLLSPSTNQALEMCRDYPQVHIELFSNGTLLLQRWSTLPQEQIYKFNLSVDAATKTTYERLRYPARWEHLQETLRFVAELGRVVQLNFVVQAANFREIPGFVQMCIDFGFQTAHFAPVLRIWHSDGMYRQMNVCDPAHEQHGELLEVLRHPLLRNPVTLCPTLYHLMER